MLARDPYDGQPYYCIVCGLGFGEYMACEEVECELESEERAKQRQQMKEQDDACTHP